MFVCSRNEWFPRNPLMVSTRKWHDFTRIKYALCRMRHEIIAAVWRNCWNARTHPDPIVSMLHKSMFSLENLFSVLLVVWLRQNHKVRNKIIQNTSFVFCVALLLHLIVSYRVHNLKIILCHSENELNENEEKVKLKKKKKEIEIFFKCAISFPLALRSTEKKPIRVRCAMTTIDEKRTHALAHTIKQHAFLGSLPICGRCATKFLYQD